MYLKCKGIALNRHSFLLLFTISCNAELYLHSKITDFMQLKNFVKQSFNIDLPSHFSIKELLITADDKAHLEKKLFSPKAAPKKVMSQPINNRVFDLNYLHLSPDVKAKITDFWQSNVQQASGGKVMVFHEERNKIIVRGTHEEILLFENYLKHLDRQPKRVKLDFVIFASEKDYIWAFGINWSGIYNRLTSIIQQNIDFCFVGLGGATTDIPVPTEPAFPNNSNLFVNPDTLAVNVFTPAFQQKFAIDTDPISGNITQGVTLPVVLGGPDLNLRRLNAIIYGDDQIIDQRNIARPTVTVSDNEIAKILVGQSIPLYVQIIDKGASLDSAINNYSELTYNDIGTSVQVKPKVVGNTIEIEFFIEFSEIISGSVDTAPDGLLPNPPTLKIIKLNEKICVEDGKTLILMSFKNDKIEEDRNSIPYIERIPIIRNLFAALGKKSAAQVRTILVTPRILE